MKFIALAVALALVIAAPWVITDPFYVHLMIMVLMWTGTGGGLEYPGRICGSSFLRPLRLPRSRGLHDHDTVS